MRTTRMRHYRFPSRSRMAAKGLDPSPRPRPLRNRKCRRKPCQPATKNPSPVSESGGPPPHGAPGIAALPSGNSARRLHHAPDCRQDGSRSPERRSQAAFFAANDSDRQVVAKRDRSMRRVGMGSGAVTEKTLNPCFLVEKQGIEFARALCLPW